MAFDVSKIPTPDEGAKAHQAALQPHVDRLLQAALDASIGQPELDGRRSYDLPTGIPGNLFMGALREANRQLATRGWEIVEYDRPASKPDYYLVPRDPSQVGPGR